MTRVNKILTHSLYNECIKKNEERERERIFCKHDMNHFLDVARIACQLCYESGMAEKKEQIYAAALLHDIGRWQQYDDNTPHEIASAVLSGTILLDCGFSEMEAEQIGNAILSHRTKNGEQSGFSGILYRADKLSRRCFDCAAINECDWDIKNTRLEY